MSQNVLTFTCSAFSAPDCHNQPLWWRYSFAPNFSCCCVCYVTGRDTVAAGDSGDGMVAAVGGALKTPSGAALRIVPC